MYRYGAFVRKNNIGVCNPQTGIVYEKGKVIAIFDNSKSVDEYIKKENVIDSGWKLESCGLMPWARVGDNFLTGEDDLPAEVKEGWKAYQARKAKEDDAIYGPDYD